MPIEKGKLRISSTTIRRTVPVKITSREVTKELVRNGFKCHILERFSRDNPKIIYQFSHQLVATDIDIILRVVSVTIFSVFRGGMSHAVF